MKSFQTKKLITAAVCLALCIILPLFTGRIQNIGRMLLPMHIPVLICGFVCGYPYGLVIGLLAPLLNSVLFGMPPMYPIATAMAIELAAYGLFSGLLYRLLPKKPTYIYITLISSMVLGRIIWGIVMFFFSMLQNTSFTFNFFITSVLLSSIPGIIIQIILVPVLVMMLKRTKLA